MAVSQRVDAISDRNEIRDALDQRLVSFLLEAGFLTVPVPNVFGVNSSNEIIDCTALDDWLTTLNPSAILLSGGNDLGQINSRDLTESILLDFAKRHKLPVLGICRGMQLLAQRAGVELHHVDGHVRTRHDLNGEINRNVNSYHNLSLNECPPEYEILSKSYDGEIEAIRHRLLPWEGWMWHPERENPFSLSDLQRIKNLFNE